MNLQIQGTNHFPGKTESVTCSEKHHRKVTKSSCLQIILSAPRCKKKFVFFKSEKRGRSEASYKEEIIRLASDFHRATINARTHATMSYRIMRGEKHDSIILYTFNLFVHRSKQKCIQNMTPFGPV